MYFFKEKVRCNPITCTLLPLRFFRLPSFFSFARRRGKKQTKRSLNKTWPPFLCFRRLNSDAINFDRRAGKKRKTRSVPITATVSFLLPLRPTETNNERVATSSIYRLSIAEAASSLWLLLISPKANTRFDRFFRLRAFFCLFRFSIPSSFSINWQTTAGSDVEEREALPTVSATFIGR